MTEFEEAVCTLKKLMKTYTQRIECDYMDIAFAPESEIRVLAEVARALALLKLAEEREK